MQASPWTGLLRHFGSHGEPRRKPAKIPPRDDTPARLTHFATPAGHRHFAHQLGELAHVPWIEGESVDAVFDEIPVASGGRGDEHGQARGHCLVHHKAPFVGKAWEDERACRSI